MNWIRIKVALLALVISGAALAQGRELPDFVKLVEEQGAAVVNISTTQAVRRTAAVPQLPGIEDEEVQEFFRRFIPRQQPGPQQGPQQGPRAESRSLGPLFNMRGEVVGVNSQIYSRTGGFMGLSFAIPIDVALDVQKQLRDKGRVSRGRIGVVIQEVSKDLATSFGLDRPRGALVNAVEKGSPADKAGVEATDIITKFDGKLVESSNDLPRIVGSTRPGAKAEVEVWRKGASKTLSITVAELMEARAAA